MKTKTVKKSWIRPETQAVFEAALHSEIDSAPVRASNPQVRVHLYAQFAQRYETLCALPRRARRSLERSWKKPLAAIALLLTLGQGTALAATINVAADTPPDISADGKCSLVEAIVNANADAATHADCVSGNGKDTIVLPAGSTQHVSSYYRNDARIGNALPVIHSAVIIEGRSSRISMPGEVDRSLFVVDPAGELTVIDALLLTEDHSGYYYDTGVTNEGSLQLVRSTVTGFSQGIDNGGSAVLNHSALIDNSLFYGNCPALQNRGGNVTVSNSLIARNRSYDDGGGLCNLWGTLVVSDSEISHNSANVFKYGVGGGILNRGTLVVTRSKVVSNFAERGGGIVNGGSAMATISDSIIEDNVVAYLYDDQPVPGAGILNMGTLIVSNSTLANNSAYGNGSGIFNSGKATLTNTTVTGNTTRAGSGSEFTLADTKGGGIYNAVSGELELANVTLVGNSAGRGGGVFNAGTVMLTRSLVTGNQGAQGAAAGREITNNGGTVMVNAFNMFGHNGQSGLANVARGATDIVPTKSVNHILLPLAHNSSKTKTHALAINSPALNASPADDGCPAKDQRGAVRPSGTKCDIGAFEGSAVMCNGVVTTHVGTAGNDVIYGTPGHDVIAGLSGNDTLQGLDGDDMICGGNGKDGLIGGRGIDTLLGGAGDDMLRGQAGDDIVNGGAGTDTCDGGTNNAAGDVAAQCEQVINVP